MQDTVIRSRIVGVNVPRLERVASVVVGGALAALGLRRRSLGGIAVAGVGAALIARGVTGRCPTYRVRALRKGIQVRRAVTIQATPQQVYEVWRDLENLPRFMQHVDSVTLEEGGISRWRVTEGPKQLEWRAEIVEDTPGRRLRWRALPGGDIRHEGSIDLRQAPGDRGTIVEVKLHYFPPGGLLVASMLPGFFRKLTNVQIGQELARLQQLIETGELTTGARRVEDLDDHDKAITAAQVAPRAVPAATTAQSSTRSVTGGAL
jgi:uncharacterized membrane protein